MRSAGVSRRSLSDAARRRMDALQEVVEGESFSRRDHDLAVEHEPGRRNAAHGFDDLGEVSAEALARLRPQLDAVAVAEGEAAEAVPLRLVRPLVAPGDLLDQSGQHRLERDRNGQRHSSASRRNRPRDSRHGLPEIALLPDAFAARCRFESPRFASRARPPSRSPASRPTRRASGARSRPRRACGPRRSGCSPRAPALGAGGPCGIRP